MSSTLSWLVPLLVCPSCRERLTYESDVDDGLQGMLFHEDSRCHERYPVIDEIPRLLLPPHRAALVASRREWFLATGPRRALAAEWQRSVTAADSVVKGFDFEWSRFSDVGTPELRVVFQMYFDQVDATLLREGLIVLDAGSGAGRWAYEVARSGPRVVAVDLGRSVEVARSNTLSTGRVGCVQADLHDLPLAPCSVDWAYALGVLHHVGSPGRALRRIAAAVRPGGPVLVYLYYALDGKGPLFRALHQAVSAVRETTSRLPRPLVFAFASATAVTVYWPLARLSAVLSRVGVNRLAAALPLSFYAERSVRLMLNDSLDRFGTRVERRYRREQVVALLCSAGLREISFSPRPPFWHAVARAGVTPDPQDRSP